MLTKVVCLTLILAVPIILGAVNAYLDCQQSPFQSNNNENIHHKLNRYPSIRILIL